LGKYPPTWTRGWPQNASQTHNDHLQIAAEEGLPGYALFLAAMGAALGAAWQRPPRKGEPQPLQATFARTLLPSLVVTVAVLALAQFPLQIAAPRLMILTFTGLLTTWVR